VSPAERATSYPLGTALFQWEEGYRRLEELRDRPRLYRRIGRVVTAVEDELRRRIGLTFSAAELAELYGRGTDWCLEVALSAAPDEAAGWDPQIVADAAFFLYLRGAFDYAGGRVSEE
jgi:hypothetical protein